MQTKVYNMAGEVVGEIELSDSIFGITPNAAVVHDSVKNHLANKRQGTQSALISEISKIHRPSSRAVTMAMLPEISICRALPMPGNEASRFNSGVSTHSRPSG